LGKRHSNPPGFSDAPELLASLRDSCSDREIARQLLALCDGPEVSLERVLNELRTEGERLREAVRDAEVYRGRLQAMTDALHDGWLLLDERGTVVEANPAAARMLGKSDSGLLGRSTRPWLQGVARGERGAIRWNAEGRPTRTWHVSRTNLEGQQGEMVLLRDVTEGESDVEPRPRDRETEDVLRAITMLAHKINNPLTALLGRAQLLRLSAGKPEDVSKGLAVIEEASQRIAALVQDLASLAKTRRA